MLSVCVDRPFLVVELIFVKYWPRNLSRVAPAFVIQKKSFFIITFLKVFVIFKFFLTVRVVS